MASKSLENRLTDRSIEFETIEEETSSLFSSMSPVKLELNQSTFNITLSRLDLNGGNKGDLMVETIDAGLERDAELCQGLQLDVIVLEHIQMVLQRSARSLPAFSTPVALKSGNKSSSVKRACTSSRNAKLSVGQLSKIPSSKRRYVTRMQQMQWTRERLRRRHYYYSHQRSCHRSYEQTRLTRSFIDWLKRNVSPLFSICLVACLLLFSRL